VPKSTFGPGEPEMGSVWAGCRGGGIDHWNFGWPPCDGLWRALPDVQELPEGREVLGRARRHYADLDGHFPAL